MLHYLKMLLRAVQRSKAFTILNMLSLTVGLTVSMLVAQYVWFEFSFDHLGENFDRTYRINLSNSHNGVFENVSPHTVPGLAFAMEQEVPGIELTGRLSLGKRAVIHNKARKTEYREDNLAMGDSSIISLLALKFISGRQERALIQPDQILISQSAAIKYFGHATAIGNTLEIGRGGSQIKTYTVVGVFADIPENNSHRFEILLAVDQPGAWNENWAWSDVITFIRLLPGADMAAIERGLASIVNKHHQDGKGDQYLLETVTDIRLHAMDGTGRIELVYFFMIMAVIVLALAWFNYINLSTARFIERMKEVGIRKMIGSSRRSLIWQFLIEAFFYNAFSMLFAGLCFLIVRPLLAVHLGWNIPITLLNHPYTYGILALSVAGSTMVSGLYPAWYLSSLHPLNAIKRNSSGLLDRTNLRRVIIIAQLSVTAIMMAAVLIIHDQITFMRSRNLGITIDQTLIIEEPLITDDKSVTKYETLRNQLLEISGVQKVTYASSFPGKEIDWHRTDITLPQGDPDHRYDSRIVSIGTEFIDQFGLRIVAGRNLDPLIESDRKALIISELASKMFGFASFEDAIGQEIAIGSRKFQVIGVVNDYHYRSLQNEIDPVMYMQGYPVNPSYAIKLATTRVHNILSEIEAKWKLTYSGNVFNYYFLDDFFDHQYKSDTQIGTITTLLAGVAILISCCGLFGLTLYAVNRRTKEIGIRKVMGASVGRILLLVCDEFISLTLIASVLALPVIQMSSVKWLEKYAHKAPLNIGIFAIPITAVFMLVLITTGFQTLKAARGNPVKAISQE